MGDRIYWPFYTVDCQCGFCTRLTADRTSYTSPFLHSQAIHHEADLEKLARPDISRIKRQAQSRHDQAEQLSAGRMSNPSIQQQYLRSKPPSVHGSSEPSSSFDIGVVHHDAHEKIHARSRHFRAEQLQTLPSDSHLEYQTPINAHLGNSAKDRLIEDLFKKFPNLVPGQESENIETSSENAVYQNIPGPSRDPSAAVAQLPDPVVDTVSDLERLAQPDFPRTSSVVSRLRNVRSVDYDTPGPEDFLAGLLSPLPPQPPLLIQNQHEEAAWAIPEEAHPQPQSYSSSLGDSVLSPKHDSDSSDLDNSGPSGEVERGPWRVVKQLTARWICSYCTNVVYEPGVTKCDVCGHLKSISQVL